MVYLGEVPLYQIALWLIAFFVLMQHVVKIIVYFLIQAGIKTFGRIPLKKVSPDSTIATKVEDFQNELSEIKNISNTTKNVVYDVQAQATALEIELGIITNMSVREITKLYTAYLNVPNNNDKQRNGYIKDIVDEYKLKKRKEK